MHRCWIPSRTSAERLSSHLLSLSLSLSGAQCVWTPMLDLAAAGIFARMHQPACAAPPLWSTARLPHHLATNLNAFPGPLVGCGKVASGSDRISGGSDSVNSPSVLLSGSGSTTQAVCMLVDRAMAAWQEKGSGRRLCSTSLSS